MRSLVTKIFAAALTLASAGQNSVSATGLTQTEANRTPEQEMTLVVLVVAQGFRDQLVDRQSARFRNSRFFAVRNRAGQIHFTLCGEVNAKNSLGGYSGWKPFWGTKKEFSGVDDPLVRAICKEAENKTLVNQDFSVYLQQIVTRGEYE